MVKRSIVYIDGFNLYYGALPQNTTLLRPQFESARWKNFRSLSKQTCCTDASASGEKEESLAERRLFPGSVRLSKRLGDAPIFFNLAIGDAVDSDTDSGNRVARGLPLDLSG